MTLGKSPLAWISAAVLSLGVVAAGCGPAALGPNGGAGRNAARNAARAPGPNKTGTKSHTRGGAGHNLGGAAKTAPRVGGGGTHATGGMGGRHGARKSSTQGKTGKPAGKSKAARKGGKKAGAGKATSRRP